uniref:Uncharacterized protein n=1 Tax=Romanomermis culicivorax TaxID=13658 RepID=A0A915IQF8_ROMCU
MQQFASETQPSANTVSRTLLGFQKPLIVIQQTAWKRDPAEILSVNNEACIVSVHHGLIYRIHTRPI